MSFVIRKLNNSMTLGEEIHTLRKATGFTLSEMAQKTKVRRNFLDAFEKNQYEELPATLYARNYLRSYLQGLGVADPDYYLTRWEEARGTCDFVDASRLPRQRVRGVALIVSSRFVKFAGVAAVLLAIAGYIGSEIRTIVSAPPLELSGPVDGLATSDARVRVQGRTDPGAAVRINGETVLLNADGTFQTVVSLERGLNVIKVEGAKRYSRSATEYRRVVLEADKSTAAADAERMEL